MSATTKTWVNDALPRCEDVDLNGFKNENNNLIEGSGQVLSTADNQQTHKAVSIYAAGGAYYTDSGSANAYVLSTIGSKVAPPAYFDGMLVTFTVTNTNTGASTVNPASLGVKNIFNNGAALTGGELVDGAVVSCRYNLSDDRFNIESAGVSSTSELREFRDSSNNLVGHVGFNSTQILELANLISDQNINLRTLDAGVVTANGNEIYDRGNTKINGYSLATANNYLDSGGFDVSLQIGVTIDITFSETGYAVYVIDNISSVVYQYRLASPWNIKTAFYENKNFDFSTQETAATGMFFKSDGTKMYAFGNTNDTVYQYSLSTPWDVSTSAYDSISFSVTAQETTPQGLFFKPDGSKMYVIGLTSATVYQYSLPTPWVLTGASYDSVSFSVAAQDPASRAIFFKSDGTKMYMTGSGNNTVYQYSLPSPWVLTGATYDSISFSVAAQDTIVTGLAFRPDGGMCYMAGNINDTVYQYPLGTRWDMSTAYFETRSFVTTSQDSAPRSVFFAVGGTKMYVLGALNRNVYQYTLKKPFHVSSASYDGASLSVNAQDASPLNITFKSDGTKMYMVGATVATVYQYTLSTPWSLTGASYDGVSFSVAAQDTIPRGVAFKSDGSKMYIAGANTDAVYQYSLPTPWVLTGATYDSVSFSVASESANIYGVDFSYDGSIMFIIDEINKEVYQYSLVNPWSIATGVNYDKVFLNVQGKAQLPKSLCFSSDGRFLYVVDDSTDSIVQFTSHYIST